MKDLKRFFWGSSFWEPLCGEENNKWGRSLQFVEQNIEKMYEFKSISQGKILILQPIWLYIIISISKEIWPTLRLSHILLFKKLKFWTFDQISLIEISQRRSDPLTIKNDNI